MQYRCVQRGSSVILSFKQEKSERQVKVAMLVSQPANQAKNNHVGSFNSFLQHSFGLVPLVTSLSMASQIFLFSMGL